MAGDEHEKMTSGCTIKNPGTAKWKDRGRYKIPPKITVERGKGRTNILLKRAHIYFNTHI